MRTPKNFFLIKVAKEQRLGSGLLYAPVIKGEEENDYKPVLGLIVGRPDKFTKDHQIASNSKNGQLTAADLEDSVRDVVEGVEVYLSYLAFDEDRIVMSDEDGDIYRVPVHHLIAIKTDKGPVAVAGKVIIKPIEEDGIISKSLISTYSVKKYGHGIVVSCTDNKIAKGLKVAYMERIAEWIEIDGVRYDFIYLDEILGIM